MPIVGRGNLSNKVQEGGLTCRTPYECDGDGKMAMLKFGKIMLAALMAMLFVSAVATAQQSSDWPVFRKDPARTGADKVLDNGPGKANLRWSWPRYSQLPPQIVADDSEVHSPSYSGSFSIKALPNSLGKTYYGNLTGNTAGIPELQDAAAIQPDGYHPVAAASTSVFYHYARAAKVGANNATTNATVIATWQNATTTQIAGRSELRRSARYRIYVWFPSTGTRLQDNSLVLDSSFKTPSNATRAMYVIEYPISVNGKTGIISKTIFVDQTKGGQWVQLREAAAIYGDSLDSLFPYDGKTPIKVRLFNLTDSDADITNKCIVVYDAVKFVPDNGAVVASPVVSSIGTGANSQQRIIVSRNENVADLNAPSVTAIDSEGTGAYYTVPDPARSITVGAIYGLNYDPVLDQVKQLWRYEVGQTSQAHVLDDSGGAGSIENLSGVNPDLNFLKDTIGGVPIYKGAWPITSPTASSFSAFVNGSAVYDDIAKFRWYPALTAGTAAPVHLRVHLPDVPESDAVLAQYKLVYSGGEYPFTINQVADPGQSGGRWVDIPGTFNMKQGDYLELLGAGAGGFTETSMDNPVASPGWTSVIGGYPLGNGTYLQAPLTGTADSNLWAKADYSFNNVIPVNGGTTANYLVDVFVPGMAAGSQRGYQVQYLVTAAGVTTKVNINQNTDKPEGEWKTLGIFPISNNGSISVVCTNYDPSIAGGSTGDIVELDDSVLASTERDGVWVAPVTPEPGAINGTYTQSPATLVNDPTTVGSFIWKPTLNPQSGNIGRYTLYVRLPEVTGSVKRAGWVEYTINTVNGPEKIRVNQAGNCLFGEVPAPAATWLRLGTFTLSKTGNPIVMLTNYTADAASAGSVIIADAIRLEQEAAVAVTDTVRLRERRMVVADAIEYSAPSSNAGAINATPAIGLSDVKLSSGSVENRLIVVVPTMGGELYGLDANGDSANGTTWSYWMVDGSVDKNSTVQYSYSSPVFATKGMGGPTMVLVNNFWGRTMAIDTMGNGDYSAGVRKGSTSLLWAYPKTAEPSLGEQIVSSPAVLNSRVFITTLYGRVHAIDLTTGEKIWQYPEIPTWGGISSTPAIFEDKIIFGTESGKVVALPASGAAVVAPTWVYPSDAQTVKPDSFVLSSPAVLELPDSLTTVRNFNKVVYIGDRSGYLWAIDAVGKGDGTTELAWLDASSNPSASRQWNGQIQSSPSFTYITRILNSWTVVFGVMGNGALYGVNALNGAAPIANSYVWGYRTEGQNVFASAAVANSWMYMASDDGFLYGFNNKSGYVNGYDPGEAMPGDEILNPEADPDSDACIKWPEMKVEFFGEKEYEAIRQGPMKLGVPNPDFRTPESVENLRLRRPGYEWGDRVYAVVYGLDVTCVKNMEKRPRSVTIGIRGNIENYQISTTFIPYEDKNAPPYIDPDTGEVLTNVKLRAYVTFNITPDRNTWWTPGQKLHLFAKPTDGEFQVGVDATKGVFDFTIYNPIALRTDKGSIGWSTDTPTGNTIPGTCEFALNGNGVGSPLAGGTSNKRVNTVVSSAGGDFIRHGTGGQTVVHVANRSKMALTDSSGSVFPAGQPRAPISGIRVIPAKLAYGTSTPFNYLAGLETMPTVPNRSLDYPDIPERSSVFFLNGSDITYGTQRVTLPPVKATNATDPMPGDKRTIGELQGRLNVNIPKYQPANDTYAGMYTVYIDMNANGRLDTGSSSDYWLNPVPSTKDETFRIFSASAKVPMDPKFDVVDKNVFLGTVSHGFADQMGVTLPSFISGSDPRNTTWKPVTMRNTGNVNLMGLRFMGLPPMPGRISTWNSQQVHPLFGLVYNPLNWMQISTTLDDAWDGVLPPRLALKPRPNSSPTFVMVAGHAPRIGARIPLGTPQGTYTGYLTVSDAQGLVPVSIGPNENNEPYGTNVLKANVTVVESRMTNDRPDGTLWQLQNTKQSGDLASSMMPSAIIDDTDMNVVWTSNRGNPQQPSWKLYFGKMSRNGSGQWLPAVSGQQWFSVKPQAAAGFPDDPDGDLFKQSGDADDTVIAKSGQHSGGVLFTYGSKKYVVWYGQVIKVYNNQQFSAYALFMANIGSDGQPVASSIDRLPFDPMLPMSKPAISVVNNRAILMWMSIKGQVMYSINSDSALDVEKWSPPARLAIPRGIREVDSARPMTLNSGIYVMVSGMEQNGDAAQAYMLRYNLRGSILQAAGLGDSTETTRLQRLTNSNVWVGRDLSWQRDDIKLFLNGVELVATSSAYDDQSGVMTFTTQDGGGYLVDLSQGTVTFPYAQPKLTDVVTAQYRARAMRLTTNRDGTSPTIYAGSNTNAIGTVESGGGALWAMYRKIANTGATQAFFGKRLVLDPKFCVDDTVVAKANAGQIKTTGILWDSLRETMIPTTGAASESYMTAVQDPKDGKLWLFWSSSRTGATDLFYQAWAPRLAR